MAGSIVSAKYLSFDASEEAVDFPGARVEVRGSTTRVVLNIWSSEMEAEAGWTDQIELALTPEEARWLVKSLDAALRLKGYPGLH